MTPADRRLLASGRVATTALVAAVALGLLTALLAIAQAALLAGSVAGAIEDAAGLDDLAAPLALLAIVLVARAALGATAEVIAQRISGAVKSDLRRRLLARAVGLGPRWASESRSGELVVLATRGLDALDGYFGRYLPQVALAGIVPLAVVVCLAAVDAVAALTVALTVPLIPVFMVLVGRMSEASRKRRWNALARLAHRFLDVVAGLPTLRAYGRADAQVAILRRVTDAYRVETMGTLRVAFLSALVLELLATISVALVAVGVGLRLVVGELSLATGLFAIILAPEAYLPLRRLGAEFHASEEGVTAARRVFEILEADGPPGGPDSPPSGPDSRPGGPDGPPGGVGAVPDLRGATLAIEGVTVVQPGRDAAAPCAAALEVRSGEIVAIAGPSGAGKSTLLAVLLGFVAPAEGRVAIVPAGGAPVDLASLDGEAWRRRVAWVPQVPFLAAGTIAENVRLAAPGASDEAVEDVLAAVGLGDLDPSMSLGERGAGLSSGQRRRIGVARALLRARQLESTGETTAPLLLLDEPTAGLDAVAESLVLEAVRRAADAGAAVILVAHRPAAALEADRVVEIGWASLPAPAIADSGGRPGAPAAAGDVR
jgi:thiol reductant ABC exporter CydD subunit